ncbi:PREDICTED: uncharacterized protein LOC109239040 [Nicotiana attenuata]|uniref:Uncharacterized protein n=1 Tax=Nicotiana attenuata TaxID=49451 RepID=A0A1J6L8W5_NICAT|nr:PREDICTED: uncharacterized protein LOC109208568 [Nicotiana attenuata]XP_019233242.1 PREDICTED: uncharacterized protein LOC109213857 [Nicotiana attenuata]XP_019261088.1 PREDICTED: uncharacterized protein LOC109239040 [Nicotiana attenuata]OIT27505.1 hypothetical protein A4A49_57374 [Nicotiana attenuata]OIT31536.1 hypothetical protein A4A49_61033 [Nicotiana attenuata]OIT38727.1 hypothetical protein A4A49_21675 [Nicotiana attenuata]
MTAAGITRLPRKSPQIRLQLHEVGRWMSKLAGVKERYGSEKKKSCWWVPHPRTGIYFPQGHERVIDDIPNGAASLTQTYWLRSEDGVDKPQSDFPISHNITYRQYYS